jgi:uncharacterized protein (DUF924 family)
VSAVAGESWLHDVLRFWFEETSPEQRFAKNEAFDAEMRRRFLACHQAVSAEPTAALLTDARTTLAAVVVLDQMPRNMFRGSPRAFATDAKALELAAAAVDRGFDRGMTKDERLFLYLPFQHAESREAQARSVALTAALGDPELSKWAEMHKVIIERFGRFPHRNAILGRPSSSEEIEFLTQPNSSF